MRSLIIALALCLLPALAHAGVVTVDDCMPYVSVAERYARPACPVGQGHINPYVGPPVRVVEPVPAPFVVTLDTIEPVSGGHLWDDEMPD